MGLVPIRMIAIVTAMMMPSAIAPTVSRRVHPTPERMRLSNRYSPTTSQR